MDFSELAAQRKRYRYYAYLVIRDCIAFYFGIPKFLDRVNLRKVVSNAYHERLKSTKKTKGRELTEEEKKHCLDLVERNVALRIRELQIDLERCEDLLFNDNIWLQLLNLNETFFKNYFKTLNQQTKDKLAIVPKYKTRDHSLGRSYINDKFSSDINF